MSSFLMLTKHGLPDLVVETGRKISKDPVLLSGLFKAIFTFSAEVADSPLQLLQIKGFTIKFISFDDEHILIIGADKNISNINYILDNLSALIRQSLETKSDLMLLEEAIKTMLEESLNSSKTDDIQDMIDIFEELSEKVLQVVFWGILTGKHFSTVGTRSLDFNKQVTNLLSYLEVQTCSQLDQCPSLVSFIDKKGNFECDNVDYDVKKLPFQVTKIIREMINLGRKHYFKDLKVMYNGINGTINSFLLVSNKENFSEFELKDINITRHVMGMEMEYYCLEQLKLSNRNSYEIMRTSVDEVEWINHW